jgi:hypothetical protein
MTTQMVKMFFDGQKVVQQEIPEHEIYKKQWPELMRGVRVDGSNVIISTKSNDAARLLCGELLKEKNGEQHE